MCLSVDVPSTALTKINYIGLTQPTVPGLMKDHFTRQHTWTSINSPIFAYFILLVILTMYKLNLIGILPTHVLKGLNI